MKRVALEPAYVLHRRSYRETSFLIEIFTKQYGRISLVARGARKARSALQGILQPFIPILISWAGNGELMTMTHAEPYGEVKQLQKECLYAGFYLNELLLGLLHKWDAYPHLYQIYAQTIAVLQNNQLEEKTLRLFEKNLLEELGYALLPKSSDLKNEFLPDAYYRFVPEQGFVLSPASHSDPAQSRVFSGKNLIAIAEENWHTESLQDAKRLIRFVLTPLLGARQIHSRKLFMQSTERQEEK